MLRSKTTRLGFIFSFHWLDCLKLTLFWKPHCKRNISKLDYTQIRKGESWTMCQNLNAERGRNFLFKNVKCCLKNDRIDFFMYIQAFLWIVTFKGFTLGFPGGSDGKESAYNAGDPVPPLDREDPLEKGMAAHSSVLAWRIPWTEEPGWLQSMGLQRVGHKWVTLVLFRTKWSAMKDDKFLRNRLIN